MSNITLFSPTNVPAFARNNELSDTAKALTGGNVSSVKRISIKGGVFRLVAGGKEIASVDERHMNVIIVKAAPKVSRIFYAKSYDADNITGPDCWSNDGERPDPTAEHKQSVTCMNCPQNAAGSGPGNSRACRVVLGRWRVCWRSWLVWCRCAATVRHRHARPDRRNSRPTRAHRPITGITPHFRRIKASAARAVRANATPSKFIRNPAPGPVG